MDDGTQNAEHSLSFRYSSILSLTTLAHIGHALGRGRPNAVALRNQRNDALRRVLLLVGGLSPREFKTLDPFISVSSSLNTFSQKLTIQTQIYWSHILELFQQEIPSPEYRNPNVSEGALCVSICFGTLWPEIPASIPEHELDFEVNVSRLTILNEAFVNSRWLPGTTTLCAFLAAKTLQREPALAQNSVGLDISVGSVY